jgi:hypothetical protein
MEDVSDIHTRLTSAALDMSSRLRVSLGQFAVGLRQVWQGYWQSPPGA